VAPETVALLFVVGVALVVFLLRFRPSRLGSATGGFSTLFWGLILHASLAAFASDLCEVFFDRAHFRKLPHARRCEADLHVLDNTGT
jgi:hypothetical protein